MYEKNIRLYYNENISDIYSPKNISDISANIDALASKRTFRPV